MPENAPTPEKKENIRSEKELTRRMFEVFSKRSDEPGEFLSEKDKERLREEGKHNPEAIKKLEENRDSKFRANSLMLALSPALEFLESSEAKNILIDKRNELIKRVRTIIKDINEAKRQAVILNERGEVIEEKPAITRELVQRAVGITKEIEPYL